jgi:hypothetical protein
MEYALIAREMFLEKSWTFSGDSAVQYDDRQNGQKAGFRWDQQIKYRPQPRQGLCLP